ncbi:MAG: molybdate ABC transporter permease subunit [Planctomycetes bacterium]|nr:molybdate ABC transporter permease subunit [Planctomycetota bacterium]
MDAIDGAALLLSARLAAVTTLVLLVLGTPLAWWLARRRTLARAVVSSLVSLPLVLPPTVLGFYLLVLLGPQGTVGRLVDALGGPRLVFSFPGLVVGSCVFSLPFVVTPLRDAFAALGSRPLEAAATLRARPLDRFVSVVVPLTRPAFLTAAMLGFAHTVGEFGVVLMLGGNIPGRTRTASLAVFEAVERMDYDRAHATSLVLLGFAFCVLLAAHLLGGGPSAAPRDRGVRP